MRSKMTRRVATKETICSIQTSVYIIAIRKPQLDTVYNTSYSVKKYHTCEQLPSSYIFNKLRLYSKWLMRLIPQNKETNQKGHSFDVRRSRRHMPAYTRERAAAMFLGSIVREFYYKQYGENRTIIIKTAPFGI